MKHFLDSSSSSLKSIVFDAKHRTMIKKMKGGAIHKIWFYDNKFEIKYAQK